MDISSLTLISVVLALLTWLGIRPVHLKNFVLSNRDIIFKIGYIIFVASAFTFWSYGGYLIFRDPDLPFRTPEKVLVMASFVIFIEIFVLNVFFAKLGSILRTRIYPFIGLAFPLAISGTVIYDGFVYGIFRWSLIVGVAIGFCMGYRNQIMAGLMKVWSLATKLR